MPKNKVNKSEKVRQYLMDHPGVSPREVAVALRSYGVSSAYVSTVKTKMKQSLRLSSASESVRSVDHGLSRFSLAAHLIKACGGSKDAHETLEEVADVARLVSQ